MGGSECVGGECGGSECSSGKYDGTVTGSVTGCFKRVDCDLINIYTTATPTISIIVIVVSNPTMSPGVWVAVRYGEG